MSDIKDLLDTIIQGDCLEVLKTFPDKSIDFCFADPPYGVNKAEWDKSYVSGYIKDLLRISKHGIAITPGQNSVAQCILEMGSEYKGIYAAFNKNGMTFSKVGFENWILVILGGDIKRGQNACEFTIWGNTKPKHPSPKPIEFMLKIINRFTEKEWIILDPFLGSGTTAVACKKLGRHFIGIELNSEYVEMANRRLNFEMLDFGERNNV